MEASGLSGATPTFAKLIGGGAQNVRSTAKFQDSRATSNGAIMREREVLNALGVVRM